MTLQLFHLPAAPDEAPHLLGSRCRECGSVSFPPRAVCPICGADAPEAIAVGQRGKVRSSAVVYNAPIGFAAPYVVGLVELAEGPVIFCPITECPAEEGAIPPGMPVELVLKPARSGGSPVIQYRPVQARTTGHLGT